MIEDEIIVEEENIEDEVDVIEENVVVNTGGTTDHSKLRKLDYESSGHTGFASSNDLTTASNNLQNQIDAITVSSDVVDVLGTYQDLQNYDTSKLTDDDIVKVLQDSTHSNAMSYYRWTITNNVGAWVYVGSEGPFYTKSESDTLLRGKANISDLSTVATTGKYKDLIDNPTTLLNVEDGYTTLTTLLQNLEDEEIDFANYEAENNFSLEIGNESGDFFEIYPGDIIKISALNQTAIIITSDMMYRFAYNETDELWSDNGDFMTSGGVSGMLSHYVTITSNQDITGTKTIRANNGLRFRYGSNYIRMAIKPTSDGMAISYFNAQGNEANNMEFSQGYNRSNKHFVPKDDKTQNLGKSDQVWNNGYINTLSDGTNSISVSNIATKTELAGKQDTLTAGTGIAITNNVISSTLEGIDYEVDQVLPATGEKGIIYLIPNGSSEQENIYDEYIWIPPLQEGESGRFEFIGTTQTDLTNYVDLTSAQTISGNKTIESGSNLSFAGTNTGVIENSGGYFRIRFGGSNKLNLNTSKLYSAVDICPNSPRQQNLGDNSYPWNNIKFTGFLGDANANYGLKLPDTTSYTASKTIATTDDIPTDYVDLTSDQTIGGNKTFSRTILPSASNSIDLGSSARKWQHLYLGGSVIWGNSYIQQQSNNIVINPAGNSVVANADNTKDLGASARRWKDLYLAGNLSDGTNETSVENINNNFAPIYDATSTYAVGDKVIYQGRLYKCNTAISTAEAWDSTKWTAINVIGEIPTNYVTTDTAQDITAIKTHTANINLKNNVSLKLGNTYSNGYSLCNDGSGGLNFKNNYNVAKYSMVDNYFTSQANSNLGTSGKLWKDLYLSGNLSDGTNSIAVNKIANKDNFVALSQADYDALVSGGTVDANTFYFIEEE